MMTITTYSIEIKHLGNLWAGLNHYNGLTRFTGETPGDSQKAGNPRQVPGACWSLR